MGRIISLLRRTEVIVALISGLIASGVTLVTTLKTVIPEYTPLIEWRMKKWPLAIACPVGGTGRTVVFHLAAVSTDQNYMIYSNSFMTRQRQLNEFNLAADRSNELQSWTLELYYRISSGEYVANPTNWKASENAARNALIGDLDIACAKSLSSLRELRKHWVGVSTTRPFKNWRSNLGHE